MPSFTRLTSRVLPLLVNDVDTDQIIPARFLKGIEKRGLGRHLFADWRYDVQGVPRADFALNRPEHHGARILLAGDNFGCGSSREHAPWALVDYGFRAILATSFGDIFRANSLKNGLLPVVVDAEIQAHLAARVAAEPGLEVTIDLPREVVEIPGRGAVAFPIDPFRKRCLLEGVDELGYILSHEKKIASFEQAREGDL
jgi:3-isopropylmalate/(R)-2-methylmalate dehydratase small subunit